MMQNRRKEERERGDGRKKYTLQPFVFVLATVEKKNVGVGLCSKSCVYIILSYICFCFVFDLLLFFSLFCRGVGIT